MFDIATLKTTGKINTGQNPDSIIYEPVTHRVLTFNGRSNDFTIFDAKSGEVISASVAVGGKPEFSQVDGKGNVYVNIEDKNEIVQINAKDATIVKRYSIAPCDGPSQSRDRSGKDSPLLGLRQGDGSKRSGYRESGCDTRDRTGSGRRGI